MKVEPKTLPGFMELLPKDQILFNQYIDIIKDVYEKYGFLPIDTPNIELSEILLAKAGGETEKQIYRFKKGDNDLALRFDLTVPTAKFVAMYYNDIKFPFKRYQIGRVYRGEKPQQGRFREFYQTDIDIIGDGELSIINDAEIQSIMYVLFKKMNIGKFTIHMNNRKVLNGYMSYLELSDRSVEILRIIDKINKIGVQEVENEIIELGIDKDKANSILKFITINGNNSNVIEQLKKLEIDNEMFVEGVNELETVAKYMNAFNVDEDYYCIDLKISRGLDYYTGTVFEAYLDDYKDFPSLFGGGRYENLAQNYTNRKLPGVGVGMGITRLFYALQKFGIIKAEKKSIAKVVVMCMNDEYEKCIYISNKLIEKNIPTQIYYEDKKVKAKFKYVDNLEIPYVILIGEDEIKNNVYTLRDMKTGEQISLNEDALINKLV